MATLKYPTNIDGSTSDYVRFTFYEYKPPYAGGPIAGAASGPDYNRSAILTRDSNVPDIVITMPNDISSNFAGNWGEKSMSGLAAAAFGAVGAVANVKDIKSGFGNVTGKLLTSVATGLAEDGLKFINQKLSEIPGVGSNLNVNDALGLVSGYIINPNTELLYQGTSLRVHGYNFKMIAQSKDEARDILEIANTFKKLILPKGDAAKFADKDVRNFIGIPHVCRISFHKAKESGEHPYLPRYKTSAITSVDVNYITEGQYMTFTGGEPIGVELRISFKELKLMFSEEIGSGPKQYR